jgi:hypothetical protein
MISAFVACFSDSDVTNGVLTLELQHVDDVIEQSRLRLHVKRQTTISSLDLGSKQRQQ